MTSKATAANIYLHDDCSAQSNSLLLHWYLVDTTLMATTLEIG